MRNLMASKQQKIDTGNSSQQYRKYKDMKKYRRSLVDPVHTPGSQNISSYLKHKLLNMPAFIQDINTAYADLLTLEQIPLGNVILRRIGEDSYLLKIAENSYVRGPKALMRHIID